MRITFLGLVVIVLAVVVAFYVIENYKSNPGEQGASDGQPS